MVTASHLPWNRNGLKFFTNAGGARLDLQRMQLLPVLMSMCMLVAMVVNFVAKQDACAYDCVCILMEAYTKLGRLAPTVMCSHMHSKRRLRCSSVQHYLDHSACHAGLNKHNIKSMLQHASQECTGAGMAPDDKVHDPGWVINAARTVQPQLVREINFMDRYAASLRDEIISGVEVWPQALHMRTLACAYQVQHVFICKHTAFLLSPQLQLQLLAPTT